MLELIATVVITASSVLLFAYWFRYTCLLILSARTSRNYAAGVAAANRLAFPEVQARLAHAMPGELERLRASLDRDYEVVTTLLKYASKSAQRQEALEQRMLAVNYKVVRAWYGVSRQFSSQMASRALDEMALVVAHFANSMGQRAAMAAAA